MTTWKLIIEATGEPAKVGAEFTTLQGDPVILTGGAAPWKPSSTGRVTVRFTDGTTREFFPAVIGCKWVQE